MIHLEWHGRVPAADEPSWGPYNVRGLEIGGGPVPQRPKSCRQFDCVDWSAETGLEYDIGDARQLPYPDSAFDYLYCSNLLEHFTAAETTAILVEWARVIRPGGHIELVLPDFMGILRDYFSGVDPWEHTQARLLGGGSEENNHRTPFTKSEFPEIIATVPGLQLYFLESSHNGGGIHAKAFKED